VISGAVGCKGAGGTGFLFYFMAYVSYLILAAQQHEAIEAFSAAMLGFVVPITIVTLVVVWLREPRS